MAVNGKHGWVSRVIEVVAAIGTRDTDPDSSDVYHKGVEAREIVNDLLRFLRSDERYDDRPFLLQLGELDIFDKDLVPLLIQYAGDPKEEKLMFSLLRLMASMTLPAHLAFKLDGLSEEVEKSLKFRMLTRHLQGHKRSLVRTMKMMATEEELENGYDVQYTSPAALTALMKVMYKPLTMDVRTDRDNDIIELSLTILRNILHVPDPQTSDASRTLHDRAIMSFETCGIIKLITQLSNNMEENGIFNMLLLEIVSHVFRGQSPADLKDSVRRVATKKQDKLAALMYKEEEMEKSRKIVRNSRHNRFGGSFMIMPVIKDKTPQFQACSLAALVNSDGKIKSRENKKRMIVADIETDEVGASCIQVKTLLYEASLQFIMDSYNALMPSVETTLGQPNIMQYDKVNYMKMVKFFMETHRLQIDEEQFIKRKKEKKPKDEGIDVDLIGSTLSRDTMLYIQSCALEYAGQLQDDSQGGIVWSRRLHHAVRAFTELLLYLEKLSVSPTEEQRDFAMNVLQNSFYNFEFLDILPKLLRTFNEKKSSKTYLKDLVVATHVILRVLGRMKGNKQYRIFVRRKRRVNAKPKNPVQEMESTAEAAKAADAIESETGIDQEAITATEVDTSDLATNGNVGDAAVNDAAVLDDNNPSEGDAAYQIETNATSTDMPSNHAPVESTVESTISDSAIYGAATQATQDDVPIPSTSTSDPPASADEYAAETQSGSMDAPSTADDATTAADEGSDGTPADVTVAADDEATTVTADAEMPEPAAEAEHVITEDHSKDISADAPLDELNATPGAPSGDVDVNLSALFEEEGMNNPGGVEENERPQYAISDIEFDFDKYVAKFAHAKTISSCCKLLETYKSNSSELNHYIIKLFHRMIDPKYKIEAAPLFYQLSTFQLFNNILNDETTKKKKFAELRGFIKRGVMKGFFDAVVDNPTLFVEILFLKDAMGVDSILHGQGNAMRRRKKKTNGWSKEDTALFRELYEQHQQSDNLITILAERFERTETSIKTRLTRLQLQYKDFGKTTWTAQDDELLLQAYDRNKEEADPVAVIVEEELFMDRTGRQIRARLKKLGINVTVAKAPRFEAWDPEADDDVLRELFDFAKGITTDLVELVDCIVEDARMGSKKRNDIKKRLKELGLIKGKKAKKKNPVNTESVEGEARKQTKKKKNKDKKRKKKRPEAVEAPERTHDPIGPLDTIDPIFAAMMRQSAIKVKTVCESSHPTVITWLREQIDDRIVNLQIDEDDKVDSKLQVAPDGAHGHLSPLISILGFLMDNPDSTPKEGQEEEDVWGIPGEMEIGELQDFSKVLKGVEDYNIHAAPPAPTNVFDAESSGSSDESDNGSDGSDESESEYEIEANPPPRPEQPTRAKRKGTQQPQNGEGDGEESDTVALNHIDNLDDSDSGESDGLSDGGGDGDDDPENARKRRRAQLELLAQKRGKKTRREIVRHVEVPEVMVPVSTAVSSSKKRRRRIRGADSDSDDDSDDQNENANVDDITVDDNGSHHKAKRTRIKKALLNSDSEDNEEEDDETDLVGDDNGENEQVKARAFQDKLEEAINTLLPTVDMSTVSMSGLRKMLEVEFGQPLKHMKKFISEVVDRVMAALSQAEMDDQDVDNDSDSDVQPQEVEEEEVSGDMDIEEEQTQDHVEQTDDAAENQDNFEQLESNVDMEIDREAPSAEAPGEADETEGAEDRSAAERASKQTNASFSSFEPTPLDAAQAGKDHDETYQPSHALSDTIETPMETLQVTQLEDTAEIAVATPDETAAWGTQDDTYQPPEEHVGSLLVLPPAIPPPSLVSLVNSQSYDDDDDDDDEGQDYQSEILFADGYL